MVLVLWIIVNFYKEFEICLDIYKIKLELNGVIVWNWESGFEVVSLSFVFVNSEKKLIKENKKIIFLYNLIICMLNFKFVKDVWWVIFIFFL